MSLESVFKLSLIMNMVDNLTNPMAKVTAATGGSISKLQSMEQTLGSMTKSGVAVAGVGAQITSAALAPVEATFSTRRALGELSSLGIRDLGALEDAARSFSDQWAGTSKADFISAAYDIKSGIASLTDEGVAQFTTLAGVTAKATKSTIGEMTDLFATGYGIYKDFYGDLSDMEFGEIFSAGISESVRAFKTSGSGMAQAIKTLGASATTAQVPLEEQLAILGSLQATMSGSEAGTKYKAFLRSAAKGGEALGLSFTNANNQLLSMPEILELLRGKFGETMDAAEKMELQKAFGDTEAVALIDLMYNKTGSLQDSILSLYGAMGGGIGVAENMAAAINETEPEKFQRLQQQIHNVTEDLGNSLLPTVNSAMEKIGGFIQKGAGWIQNHQQLVQVIMLVVLALGGFLTVGGTVIAVVGSVGLVFTKTAGLVTGFIGAARKLPGILETVQIYGLYAGDGIKKGFGFIKSAGIGAVSSVKNVALHIASMSKASAISGASALKGMALGLAGMAKQALVTAGTALGPLITSVWSFTAALLANPITWVIIGIAALIAGIVLLYNKCEWFRNLVNSIFGWAKDKLGSALAIAQNVFGAIGGVIGKVMGAAKATVEEKLGNMKRAYEEHGGGIRGIAAAAVEGIKGYYTAGFTFLDNLTGGKLSAIRDKFNEKMDGVKASVSSAMELSRQYATSKLEEMRAAYEEKGGGIRGAMAATMAGICSLAQDGFTFLDNLAGGKLSAIQDKFNEKMDGVKASVSSAMELSRQYATSKLEEMRAAYEEKGGGMQGAMAAATAGIQSLAQDGFTFLDNLTGGKLSAIQDKFNEKMDRVKASVSSAMELSRQYATSKLEEMRTAYEENGGGMQGAMAAAMAGIQSLAQDGFTFVDNLAEGKLSAIQEKFNERMNGVKASVSSAMELSQQYAASKLEEMRAAYEEKGGGMRGAMAATMAGICSLAQDGFTFVDNLTGGKLSAIQDKFSLGIQGIKDRISGAFSWFRESGKKVISTFTEGIQSAISAPVEAVKNGLQKIRNMLPFSDAKTGPLSTLTLSGQRTLTTYASGIRQAEAAPAGAAQSALGKLQARIGEAEVLEPKAPHPDISPVFPASFAPSLSPVMAVMEQPESVGIEASRPPVRTVERYEVNREKTEINRETSEKEKGVHIGEFHLTVDFSKLKELPALIKFLREIEDYANANGLATQGEE